MDLRKLIQEVCSDVDLELESIPISVLEDMYPEVAAWSLDYPRISKLVGAGEKILKAMIQGLSPEPLTSYVQQVYMVFHEVTFHEETTNPIFLAHVLSESGYSLEEKRMAERIGAILEYKGSTVTTSHMQLYVSIHWAALLYAVLAVPVAAARLGKDEIELLAKVGDILCDLADACDTGDYKSVEEGLGLVPYSGVIPSS